VTNDGKTPCFVANEDMKTKYDRPGAIPRDMGLSIAQGLFFSGADYSGNDCRGFLPFEGQWEEAAARFGTVQDYDVIEMIRSDDGPKVILGAFLDDDLEVDLPRDRDLKEIIKKSKKKGCDVMVKLFSSEELKLILDAEAICQDVDEPSVSPDEEGLE